MKFTTLTPEQKEQETRKAIEEKNIARRNHDSKWHRKFAWKPVRLKSDRTKVIWLEFVLRKGSRTDRSFMSDETEMWTWQYLESEFDLLAHPEYK